MPSSEQCRRLRVGSARMRTSNLGPIGDRPLLAGHGSKRTSSRGGKPDLFKSTGSGQLHQRHCSILQWPGLRSKASVPRETLVYRIRWLRLVIPSQKRVAWHREVVQPVSPLQRTVAVAPSTVRRPMAVKSQAMPRPGASEGRALPLDMIIRSVVISSS